MKRENLIGLAIFGGIFVLFYYISLFSIGIFFVGIGLFFIVMLMINAVTAKKGEMLNGMVFMAPLMFLMIGGLLLLINLIFV